MDAAAGDALHIWWLGQSGFLFKQAGAWLLVDPYLSDSLTLKYAATDKPHVRMTERCIEPEKLCFVPLVASSHQHTDHFDEATLAPLANARGELDLVLPAAVEAHAKTRLISANVTYHDIDSGTSVELHGWHVQGVAAAHNEVERDELGRCKFLGFVIKRNGFTVYHSGDTLLHPGLARDVPQGCDVMFLPINGNKPERRVAGNMSGPEAAEFASSKRAKLVIPHHFDMFTFNTEAPDAFTRACVELRQLHRVMACGERLSVTR